MKTLEKIGVLQLIDSLTPGGAENVAVLLANNLPSERYISYLCATRDSGALQDKIKYTVTSFNLNRRSRYDLKAILQLTKFIKKKNISIIHAHSTSLFIGVIVSLFSPKTRLVWHDHFGENEVKTRQSWLYRPFALKTKKIFTVTRSLADWCVKGLGVPENKVCYLPNFVEPQKNTLPKQNLPGIPGKRVVYVANIRKQKDHINLVRSLLLVSKEEPLVHLILVGARTDQSLAEKVQLLVQELNLKDRISWLGQRDDVPEVLAGCDIGVLSSISEGFPVALLEYGMANLPVVATQVGEVAEILDYGKAGFLVSPSKPNEFAESILKILRSSALAKQLGENLHSRVMAYYTSNQVIKSICEVYEQIL